MRGATTLGLRLLTTWKFTKTSMAVAIRSCSGESYISWQEVPEFLHKQVHDAKLVTLPQDFKTISLEPRKMSDSYAKVTIPLTGNTAARLRYLNAKENVRVGRLLEDLDHFAVWLCYLHNRADSTKIDSPGSLPRSIVTGCVDKIATHGMHLADRDIVLDGHVSWVGRSSMESTMRVFQTDASDNLQQMMKAKFVLVSRDASDISRSMPVHPLIMTSPEEAAIFHSGVEANFERKHKTTRSLLKTSPTLDEWNHLHSLFLDNLGETNIGTFRTVLRPNQVLMEATEIRNTLVCFPEFQNIYGKIFGGFLMREAVELAFKAGKYLCKGPVSVVSIDDIIFQEAVKIGDLIQFTARVVYTKGHFMQVRVYAETCDEYFSEKKTSNVFHVTLAAEDAKEVPQVVPGDYASGMLYLSGKRKFEKVARFLK